ncbi:MAG: chitobiase/beta-hexosaminidase C-terminal domain-containing protein, partial [Clostridia bacterium]|nr:chitobiase/beta-hexosaminidase C-terminal domain-containing protein [Clostridia bacterium]
YPLESDPYDYLMALLVREGKQEEYAALLDYRAERQPGYVVPEPPAQAVAAPTVTPEGGNYTGSVHISMKAEEGASIYFTIDGTEPTKASRLYTGPVILYSGTYTLRAAAFLGSSVSDEVDVVYVIS